MKQFFQIDDSLKSIYSIFYLLYLLKVSSVLNNLAMFCCPLKEPKIYYHWFTFKSGIYAVNMF